MNIYEKISTEAEAVTPELVTLRRDFHKHAEPGWLEMRTSSIIARKLTELGYEVLVGEDVCKKDARMACRPILFLKMHTTELSSRAQTPNLLKRHAAA